MGQLREIESKLIEAGFRVIAVSPDRPEQVRRLSSTGEYAYTLLSDSDLDLARALGVAYRVDDETVEALESYGLDIEEASGREHHLLPVPSVFILDEDGTILFEHVNPDYRERIDPDLLVAAAEAAAD